MRVHVWTRRADFDAESVDLSLGGMLLAHPTELIELGETVELEVSPPGPPETVRLAGEVVRVADPGGIGRPGLLGLRFTESIRDGIVRMADRIQQHVPWLPSMFDADEGWREIPLDDDGLHVLGRMTLQPSGGQPIELSYATALSPTALFVRTDQVIDDGTAVDITLNPPSNGVREIRARVAMSVPQDSPDRLLPGLGIDLGPRAWIVGQRPVFTCDRL